jgi:hypothetical protein
LLRGVPFNQDIAVVDGLEVDLYDIATEVVAQHDAEPIDHP